MSRHNENLEKVTAYVPVEIYERFERMCKNEGRSLSSGITNAIRKELNKEKPVYKERKIY